MKFIHIADMHFDSPFTNLSNNNNFGDKRRLEERKIFKKVIDYIAENNIDCLFISGDLYEEEYVKLSTIEFLNNLFKTIPNTKIFISPGNHDPYKKASMYEKYKFNDNVYIFKGSIEKVELEDANIYGMAFNSFYMSNSEISKFILPVSPKPNIFVLHCDLNGSRDENGFEYNPISETELKALKFDYIAMGHIHKTNFQSGKRIVYPGSTISHGFDELGSHGMVVGEITKEKLITEFIKLDDREFVEFEVNVEAFSSKEDLIEYIQNLKIDENNFYKIVLCGKRNFEIDEKEILNLLDIENILKIKNKTKLNYNLEELASENNLKGYFIREILNAKNNGNYTDEEIEKAIEIGLEAM